MTTPTTLSFAATIARFRSQTPLLFWGGIVSIVTLLTALVSVTVTVTLAQQTLTAKSEDLAQCNTATETTIDVNTGLPGSILKTINAKGECVADQRAMNAVCASTRCTAVDPVNNLNCMVPPNQTWDEYDATLGRCVKSLHPSCEQQQCDAAYCTSSSVLQLLPTHHKITAFNGQCINPGETTIASECNNLENHTWLYPACLPTTPQPVITVVVTSATTSRVKGTLSYPNSSSPTTTTTPDLFTYTLSNPLTSLKGNLILGSANINCAAGLVCFDFELYLGSQLTRPGTYDLILQARPQWVSDSGLFSKVSVYPLSVTITPTVDGVEYASMNPNPQASVVVAQGYNVDTEWMLKWLNRLKQMTPALFVTGPLPQSFPLIPSIPVDSIVVSSAPSWFALLAPPEICPLENNRLLNTQIVILAWNDVPLPPTVGPLENTDYTVRYSVTKIRQGMVGASVTLLSAAVKDKSLNIYPVFVDCIKVGDIWNYTIQAFLTSVSKNWTDQNTPYKSEPVVVSVVAAPFPEDVCHATARPASEAQLPPWMWATPQGCVWYANNQSAADYYCAVEYNQPQPSFNPDAIYLATSSNKCELLGQSYPEVTQEWSPFSCDHITENNRETVCFVGDSSEPPRAATCKYALPLGKSADTVDNVSAFSQRMDNIVNFRNIHYPLGTTGIDLTSINTTPEQQALYMTNYFMCGPNRDSQAWASSDKSKCDDLDNACKRLSATSGCDTKICGQWNLVDTGVPTSATKSKTQEAYLQYRTCFADKQVADAQCCPSGKTYDFDKARVPAGMCFDASAL